MSDPVSIDKATVGVTDVVLLAGMVSDSITRKYPDDANKINNLGIKTCLGLLNGRGIDRVIYTSSCSNYGVIAKNETASETHVTHATSSYAADKIKIEKYLIMNRSDYAPTILRFATAFGLSTRLRLDLTINEFTYLAKSKGKLTIFNPTAWRPYCHVKDFARLINLVLLAPKKVVDGEIFNAGGDQNNYTKQGIVDLITKYVPDVKIQYEGHSPDIRDYKVNFSKVKNVLNFVPEYSVEYGIKELLDAMGSHVYDNINHLDSLYGNYEIFIDN